MGQAYEWDPAAERDEPTRKVFRKGPRDYTQLRTHHLHLTVKDGDYWRRILAFRDQLRQDPNAAAQYGAVKRSLLGTCGGDSRAYTRGKHDVVKKIERAAVSTFPTQTCAPEVPLHPPERATASRSSCGDRERRDSRKIVRRDVKPCETRKRQPAVARARSGRRVAILDPDYRGTGGAP